MTGFETLKQINGLKKAVVFNPYNLNHSVHTSFMFSVVLGQFQFSLDLFQNK